MVVDDYLLSQIETGEFVFIKRRNRVPPPPSSFRLVANKKKAASQKSSSRSRHSSSEASRVLRRTSGTQRLGDGEEDEEGRRGREAQEEEEEDDEAKEDHDYHQQESYQVETLLCCRDAVYTVNRNEIDGQLLIAFHPEERGGPESQQPHSEKSTLKMTRNLPAATGASSLPSSVGTGTTESLDEDSKISGLSGHVPWSDRENDHPNLSTSPSVAHHAGHHPAKQSFSCSLKSAWPERKNEDGKKADEGRERAVLGIPIVGLSESILLLESTVGRIDQISSLLSLSPSELPFYLSPLELQQLRLFRSSSLVSSRRIPSHLNVFPSSLIFHMVQASYNEIQTALFGGARASRRQGREEEECRCSSSAYLGGGGGGDGSFESHREREKKKKKKSGEVTEGTSKEGSLGNGEDVAMTAVRRDLRKQFLSELCQTVPEGLPECWGGRSIERSLKLTSEFFFFVPRWRGFFSLSFRAFLKFVDRLLLFFTFADFSSSSSSAASSSSCCLSGSSTICKNTSSPGPVRFLTIGEIHSLLQDMEKKGFSVSPFTTKDDSSRQPNAREEEEKEEGRRKRSAEKEETCSAAGPSSGGPNEEGLPSASSSSSSCGKNVTRSSGIRKSSPTSAVSSSAPLPLEPGLLFQILSKFCDIKLPRDSLPHSPSSSAPPLPLHYIDMCPPLPSEIAEWRTATEPRDQEEASASSKDPCTACPSTSSLSSRSLLDLGEKKKESEDDALGQEKPAKSGKNGVFSSSSSPSTGVSSTVLSGIEQYEAFLCTDVQVNRCKVHINWLKLHSLLALNIFHEEGAVDTVQCGVDKEEYLEVSSIPLSSFCSSLAARLQQLPLNVTQAADDYLRDCLRRYCAEVQRSLKREIERKKDEASSLPHIDTEELIHEHLVHHAFHTLPPIIRYALAKKAFGRKQSRSRLREKENNKRGEQEEEPEEEQEAFRYGLSDRQLLQANTVGFPELRIPSRSRHWDKYDIQSSLCDALKKRRDRASPSSSSSSAFLKDQEQSEVYTHRLEEKKDSLRERRRQSEASFSSEDNLRGVSVYQEAYAMVKEKLGEYSPSLHLSVLSGYAFYAEGKLIYLPEDRLPVHTRERLAVLFMVKSPWWDSELTAYVGPTLLGKVRDCTPPPPVPPWSWASSRLITVPWQCVPCVCTPVYTYLCISMRASEYQLKAHASSTPSDRFRCYTRTFR